MSEEATHPLWRSARQRARKTLRRVFMVGSCPPSMLDAPLYGYRSCPHLVHADIVPKGALNHWGVVIDVQDGHLQDVVFLPWRGAMVRCHNLEEGHNGSQGLRVGEGSGIWSPKGLSAWQGGLAGPSGWPASSGIPRNFCLLPNTANSPCLIIATWDPCLESDFGVPSLYLLIPSLIGC